MDFKFEVKRSWYDVFYPPGQPHSGVINATNVWEVPYNKKCVHDTILAPRASGVNVPPYINAEEASSAAGSAAGGVGTAVIVAGAVMSALVVLVMATVVLVRRRRSLKNNNRDVEGHVHADNSVSIKNTADQLVWDSTLH